MYIDCETVKQCAIIHALQLVEILSGILDFMYLPFHEIAQLTKIHCDQFEYFENILRKT